MSILYAFLIAAAFVVLVVGTAIFFARCRAHRDDLKDMTFLDLPRRPDGRPWL